MSINELKGLRADREEKLLDLSTFEVTLMRERFSFRGVVLLWRAKPRALRSQQAPIPYSLVSEQI